MSGQVPALVALDRDAEQANEHRWNRVRDEEAGSDQARVDDQRSQEARAAVAELIAADSDYDSARAAWLADHSRHDKFLAAHTAWDRRAAALARVKGEAA